VRPVVSALVVVDVQTAFVQGEHAVADASALLARIADLVARARAGGALVVHLRNDGLPGSPDEPGTPGWQLALPVLASADELVVDKATDDGFHQTDLADLLAERGVRGLAVCGVLSEMCVSATARAALAIGYHVVLPHDGHATCDIPAAPGISGPVPADQVSRVAEWALGDQIDVVAHTSDVGFTPP
jgi:streptothricin hydrolase